MIETFHHLRDHIVAALPTWGYPMVFAGVMLENAGIPVPGETILLTAGYLSFTGTLDLWAVILTAFAGAVVGDSLGYLAGHMGGRPLLDKYGRLIFISHGALHRVERLFDRYGPAIIFVARFVAGLRIFAAPVAGVGGMPYRKFLFFNVTGAILWSVIIGHIGYLFGHGKNTLAEYFEYADEVILIAAGCAAGVYLLRHALRLWRR